MSKMMNNMVFTASVVDLAEEQDYLTLRNKVCFFNEKNLNNVQLDYDDSTLEKCQTLINMPVCAKYVKRGNKDDLGGHEVKVVDGKVKFGTATIGVVTGIEIKEEDVEITTGEVVKLPVLYADERIWTRNENYAKSVRRLYSEGKLYSSWEIKTSEYTFKDNVKKLVDYSFLANCLLGTQSFPAYGKGGAVVTELSEAEEQYEYLAAESILEEALTLDIESMSASNDHSVGKEEDEIMEVKEEMLENSELEENTTEVVETEEVVESEEVKEQAEEQPEISDDSEQSEQEASADEVAEEQEKASEEVADKSESEEQEQSAMKTDMDIRNMLESALHKETNDEDYWYYLSMVFPEEKIILARTWRMDELHFLKFNYSIEGDKAVLSGREDVELTASPLQINSEIEKKNDALASANNKIVELENQVSELTKAKDELDKIKAEQETAERAKKVEELRDYAKKSNLFSDEEMKSKTFNEAISSLNEAWIKAEIADRLVASLAKTKDQKTEELNTSEVESSVSIVLSENEGKDASPEDVMKAFFNGD